MNQMNQMNRFVQASVALMAGVALVGTAAGSASAATGRATASRPRVSFTITLTMKNGNHFSTGQPNPVAGNPIIQTSAPGRTFTFSNSTTVGEFDAGTMKLANGNFMAANESCTGVTIKSDSGSDGTIWYIIPNGANDTEQLASRFCMGSAGDNLVIYGDNVAGDQWKICDTTPGKSNSCGTGEFWNLVPNE
jgi:hypothetical protein